jgi:nicotinamidase-related amidase
MPLTEMDPGLALIVIDLQKGVLHRETAHPVGEVTRRAAHLARVFRRHGLPVVMVNASGGAPGRTDSGVRHLDPPSDWTELIDELGAEPEDHRITKERWGAFHETGLHQLLGTLDVTQVVLAGVATSIGVESTARSAHEHGYHVVLVTDAMTDVDADAHAHSVERIFPRLGETTTTSVVIQLLEQTR